MLRKETEPLFFDTKEELKQGINVDIPVSLGKSNNVSKKRVNKQNLKNQKKLQKINHDHLLQEISDNESQNSKNLIFDYEAFKVIKEITRNFQFTFKEIQNRRELKQYPLKDLPKEDIQYIIRKERQKLQRHYGMDNDNKGNKFSLRNSLKRQMIQYEEQSEDDQFVEPLEQIKKQQEKQIPKQYVELARLLIQDFNNQSIQIQQKILTNIAVQVQNDETILSSLISQQVQENYDKCCLLFQDRRYQDLTQVLNEISPISAIILNFKISQTMKNLIDESGTLIQTFLPFLQECNSFDFIKQEYLQTSIRFIQTLVQYFQDTQETIDYGLTVFAIHFSPSAIQKIIKTEKDKKILQNAFIKRGFKKEQSSILSNFPTNFLWQEMIQTLLNLNQVDQLEIMNIFSKLIIIQNPAPYLADIMNLLAQRRIFGSSLIELQEINLTLQQLIQVLDSLKSLETEQIQKFFKQDPKTWIKISLSYQEQNQRNNDEEQQKNVNDYFNQILERMPQTKINDKNDILQCSQTIQNDCEFYQHNQYQCEIAQIVASQKENFIIVEMPTGSGKTWVQAILAKYFIQKGKKVTLIEPNENLKNQTQELLSNMDHDLQIMTIDEFYEYPPDDEVILMNEYDLIIKNSSFKAVNYGLTGLWQLLNRKTFFFTATTYKNIEKIIKNFYKDFTIVRFKSEFEILNNVSHLSSGQIKTFKSQQDLKNQVKQDIIKEYDLKPIILFCEKAQTQEFVEILQEINLQKFLIGSSIDNLKEIRSWKYGILILNPNDAIGVNTKFSIDSIVLITNEVKNESQYLQAQGRSSRARGQCESIYYVISNLSPQSILSNLRNKGLNGFQDLERLLKIIWYKRNSKPLQDAIENCQVNEDKIQSLKDLEQILGKPKYIQLTKGIQY